MKKIKYRYNPETRSYVLVPSEPKKGNLFRRLLVIVVIISLAFFLLGGILAYFEYMSLNTYIIIASIVGSVASTVGLISLAASKLSKTDFEDVGLEYLKEFVEASAKLKQKESDIKQRERQLSEKADELKQLEIKKAEIELLVRKTSLIIFLKDQFARTEEQIIAHISADMYLAEKLNYRNKLKAQLEELNEEIERNGQTETIEEIIKMIQPSNDEKQATPLLLKIIKSLIETK